MQKLLLSLSVFGAFLLYSFHEQREAATVHVVAPKNLSSSQSHNSPTPTTGSASTPPDTSSPQPTATPIPTQVQTASGYKDGQYTGSPADAFYGTIQVKATIIGGKLTDVQFLQYPNDRGTSIVINQQAMPYLKQEAIQAQSAQVDIVSGATDSSEAFSQSLQSALDQAKS